MCLGGGEKKRRVCCGVNVSWKVECECGDGGEVGGVKIRLWVVVRVRVGVEEGGSGVTRWRQTYYLVTSSVFMSQK